ncbi:MAG TPA: FAD-binding oxidoreductase [Gemmatimonadaceae bacterium]|jgi:FAD/FMN-containing dehydrogenase|nr:FAD-binding oxidoreductase [Gemmatimonadaceae bacterium]
MRRVAKTGGIALGGTVLLAIVMGTWGMVHTPVTHPAPPRTVNDITRLNPIPVADVIVPTTVEQIVAAVRAHPGPVSIGGGRYSMGGQTAVRGGIQIDMRKFNRVLAFDSIHKTITVQPGIRWRDIQRRVDPANLSVKIMQTYADFTVGGSMSVNVHGRYIGLGPLVLSVRSFKIVLADGSLVEASPTTNPEIFRGAIGGYGGLGVIVEATLDLADNAKVKRHNERMPITRYYTYFKQNVRDSSKVVFHNGDIYPPAYERVNAVTWSETSDPVTVPEHIMPEGRSYRLDRFVYGMMSEWPFGKRIREHVVDPLLFRGTPVEWRNYEASYDVRELEPASREKSTYVLEEYFIPVEQFDAFVPKMRAVFQKHRVNVINVSIRHAKADTMTLLSWAPREAFAFVVYYKQGTTAPDRREVGAWTREMTDSILSVGGTYYLPYQPWATDAQFLRAYPRAPEFFALKRRLDPTNKFRNTLWDKYYLPRLDASRADLDPRTRDRIDSAGTYRRDEGQTFLTHPEWYIVYSSDEYAAWLRDKLPTEFPYAASIGQFWIDYREAYRQTRHAYPFNTGYHVMLGVIGTSYSAELALKGLYENTVGRFSGWTADHQLSDEDHYAAEVAADYGKFIHIRPWYEYSFASKLGHVWTGLPAWGARPLRKWERKMFLSMEYGFKAVYAEAITLATHAAYTPQDDRMQMVVTGWSDSVASRYPTMKTMARLDAVHTLVSSPRYDEFRDALLALSRGDTSVRLTEIAGNREILLTGVVPANWSYRGAGRVLYTLPLPTDRRRKRYALRVPTEDLLVALRQLPGVDHIYDY